MLAKKSKLSGEKIFAPDFLATNYPASITSFALWQESFKVTIRLNTGTGLAVFHIGYEIALPLKLKALARLRFSPGFSQLCSHLKPECVGIDGVEKLALFPGWWRFFREQPVI